MTLLEKKKQLDSALDNLERLVDLRFSEANNHSFEAMKAIFVEETRLAKETIIIQAQEIEGLRKKNKLALEVVQDMIKSIET